MKINSIDYSIKTKSLDIFFSGCNPPFCKDCYNSELTDFNCGTDWKDFTPSITGYISNYYNLIENIFLVGGSPNHQNMKEMERFLEWISHSEKNIWLFAREDIDNIQPIFKKYCSYIKCGPYIPELKCDNNIYKINGIKLKLATSNQKVYEKGRDY